MLADGAAPLETDTNNHNSTVRGATCTQPVVHNTWPYWQLPTGIVQAQPHSPERSTDGSNAAKTHAAEPLRIKSWNEGRLATPMLPATLIAATLQQSKCCLSLKSFCLLFGCDELCGVMRERHHSAETSKSSDGQGRRRRVHSDIGVHVQSKTCKLHKASV